MNENSFSRINRQCGKRLLFRIGIDAGFFSEYNNMILTLHYCLVNKIMFILNSKGANFSFRQGWQDYFIPFTSEYNFPLTKYYQNRFSQYKPIRIRDKFGFMIFCKWLKIRNIDFLTSEILPLAINQDTGTRFVIPGTELNGTLAENCRILSEMIWHFKPDIEQQTKAMAGSVNLPEQYIGFHIRRGDKQKEAKFLPLQSYIRKAEQYTSIRVAFVATDDYSVFKELCDNYGDWKFYTLTGTDERGYHQAAQLSKNPLQIKNEMLNLLTTVEILAKSEYFFGTFSSNISLFLALRLPQGHCIGVDFNEWRIWK